QLTTRSTAL
ncbi:alcohol dehydrogenase GroES-like domain protein, partial [Vibrio parahaemolyticus 10296]